MKYCPRCANIVSDKSNSRFTTECCDCHIPYEEDEMTGDEFENLSEKEKEKYTISLLKKIKKMPSFDENACCYGHPAFYFSYWFDKYEKLMNVNGATAWRADRIETEEEMKQRLDREYGKNSPAYQQAVLQNAINATREKKQVNSNIVRCFYCNSTNVKRISTFSKILDFQLFGFFGQKRRYQWHCNNCNSDF